MQKNRHFPGTADSLVAWMECNGIRELRTLRPRIPGHEAIPYFPPSAATVRDTPTQQAAAERLLDNNDNILRAEAANYVYRVDEFNRGHIDKLPEASVGLNLLDQEQIPGLKDAVFKDKETGFGAVLFELDIRGETLLTYRGTNNSVTGKQDWKTNASQGVGFATAQYNQGMKLVR